MPETPITLEAQEMLPEAVEQVIGLYLGDQLSNVSETPQTPEQRDEYWQETAKQFGPFSEKITKLRKVLKDAYVTKNAYPKLVIDIMRFHFYFSEFNDLDVRELLTDLLFARTISSPGHIDHNPNKTKVAKEAQAMVTELRAGGKLDDEALKKVTLKKVVEQILMDGLKLSRQTQLEGK